jgi:hypothetical protein
VVSEVKWTARGSAATFGRCAKVVTDLDYIKKVQMAWPRNILARDTEVSATIALRLVEEDLSAFPKCAKLFCMKGDLIQLSDGSQYKLADARRCYEQAVELAPEASGAYGALGFSLMRLKVTQTARRSHFAERSSSAADRTPTLDWHESSAAEAITLKS